MTTAQRTALAVGGLAIFLAGIAACGAAGQASDDASPKSTPVTKTVNAPMDVPELIRWGATHGANLDAGEAVCVARDGVVSEGDQVVLRDAEGKTIAVGELSSGYLGEGPVPAEAPCVFTVEFAGVPLGDGDFFEVQIGTADPVSMPKDELTDPAMTIDLDGIGDTSEGFF